MTATIEPRVMECLVADAEAFIRREAAALHTLFEDYSLDVDAMNETRTCTCCGYVYPAADLTDTLCPDCAEDAYCEDEARRDCEERAAWA